MNVTVDQINYIESEIRNRGIEINDLVESMVDHICSKIESTNLDNFELAMEDAMTSFGNSEMNEVQKEIISFNLFKRFRMSKRFMFSFGFIAAFLISTGILFKIMHWPWANISMVSGVFILNFGFLPMYFYGRYKEAIKA